MRRIWALGGLLVLAVVSLTGAVASADNGGATHFSARLTGFNEVPPILTDGAASFSATVNGSSLTYRLTYSGLTSTPTQSHLHFAEKGVNGGVFVFLCSNLGNGPAGTPACPSPGGTVTRTVTAADFIGVAAQNVPAANFQNALRIIRSGDAYANLHSVNFPAGEIRGQVKANDGD